VEIIIDVLTFGLWSIGLVWARLQDDETINTFQLRLSLHFFGMLELRGRLCNNFVLKWLRDYLLDTTWHLFFQAHFRKVQR
jgi:hypothetical protein